jgi:hypothetical protein
VQESPLNVFLGAFVPHFGDSAVHFRCIFPLHPVDWQLKLAFSLTLPLLIDSLIFEPRHLQPEVAFSVPFCEFVRCSAFSLTLPIVSCFASVSLAFVIALVLHARTNKSTRQSKNCYYKRRTTKKAKLTDKSFALLLLFRIQS